MEVNTCSCPNFVVAPTRMPASQQRLANQSNKVIERVSKYAIHDGLKKYILTPCSSKGVRRRHLQQTQRAYTNMNGRKINPRHYCYFHTRYTNVTTQHVLHPIRFRYVHAVSATIPNADAYPRIRNDRRKVSGTITKREPPNRNLSTSGVASRRGR